jgi:hypothetical protein
VLSVKKRCKDRGFGDTFQIFNCFFEADSRFCLSLDKPGYTLEAKSRKLCFRFALLSVYTIFARQNNTSIPF